MLKLARERFAKDKLVKVVKHDLNVPLPASQLGCFDLVVSGLAIHHVNHERKKQLYQEIFDLLNHNGVFCNLEHIASPTESLHRQFLTAVGLTPETDDPQTNYWMLKHNFDGSEKSASMTLIASGNCVKSHSWSDSNLGPFL